MARMSVLFCTNQCPLHCSAAVPDLLEFHRKGLPEGLGNLQHFPGKETPTCYVLIGFNKAYTTDLSCLNQLKRYA